MLRAGVFTVLLINFLTFYLNKTYLLKTMNFNHFYDAYSIVYNVKTSLFSKLFSCSLTLDIYNGLHVCPM